MKRRSLSLSSRDYHSLTWLTYVYLQQGRYSKAEEQLALMGGALKEQNDQRMRRSYNEMATMFTIETGRWDSLAKLLSDLPPPAPQPAAPSGEHAHGATPPAQTSTMQSYGGGLPRTAFARGFAAASSGRVADADAALTELATALKRSSGYQAQQIEIMHLEVSALASAAKGNMQDAIAALKKAAALEESLSPPSGPPDVIKPSHELLGEMLLRAGKPEEASEQFARSLARQPNRARSLLGAARAASSSGNTAAAHGHFSNLTRVWKHADAPLLEQAREDAAKSPGR